MSSFFFFFALQGIFHYLGQEDDVFSRVCSYLFVF